MYSIIYQDLGTPPSESTRNVTLEIDGASVSVPEGTSIMRAAAAAGSSIPKLCATGYSKSLRLLPAVPGRN